MEKKSQTNINLLCKTTNCVTVDSVLSFFSSTGATTASILPNITLQDDESVLATGRLYDRAADESFVAQGGTKNLFDCQFNYNCTASNETATVTDVSRGCRLVPGERINPTLHWFGHFLELLPLRRASQLRLTLPQ